MKILIAEDDSSSRNLYKKLMKKWEFDYEMVSNGMEAVKQVYESTFDLCLMDIEMPLLTGDEASILIRHITENLPIIAVTADSEFMKKYSEYGMNACILKPFQINSLYEIITEFAGE